MTELKFSTLPLSGSLFVGNYITTSGHPIGQVPRRDYISHHATIYLHHRLLLLTIENGIPKYLTMHDEGFTILGQRKVNNLLTIDWNFNISCDVFQSILFLDKTGDTQPSNYGTRNASRLPQQSSLNFRTTRPSFWYICHHCSTRRTRIPPKYRGQLWICCRL